jgi:hypothetical protein
MKVNLVARTQLLLFCLLVGHSVFAQTALVVSGPRCGKWIPVELLTASTTISVALGYRHPYMARRVR